MFFTITYNLSPNTYNLTPYPMTTISVPLRKDNEEKLDELVRSGVGSSRADVMRKALERLAEDEAVETVLRAEKELSEGKVLRGDLRKLLKQFS